jgi:hypothetical protein
LAVEGEVQLNNEGDAMLVRSRSVFLLGLGLLTIGGVQAQAVLAPPVSVVSAGCGPGNGVYTSAGPASAGLQLACDKREVGFSSQYGPYDYQALSSVNSGLAMGGSVDANAELTMKGGEPYRMWGAGAGGFVRYTMGVSPMGVAPPQAVSQIPVRFSAMGEARVTNGDGGSFNVSAWLDNVSFHSQWEGAGSNSGGFSNAATVVVSAAPGNGYTVLVSAECRVTTWSGGAGSGRCSAAADPSFSFDQAAFDSTMGAQSFALDSYFRIDLSPGVTPVPELSSLNLLGLGGLVLAARLGQRRRSAARS